VPKGAIQTEMAAFVVVDLFVAITEIRKVLSLVKAVLAELAAGLTIAKRSIAAILDS
jgi:hypothetical protein